MQLSSTTFDSDQAKFGLAISGKFAGMSTDAVKRLHQVAYEFLSPMRNYFPSTQGMLNYLTRLGFKNIYFATGGTPYPLTTKATFTPQYFNSHWGSGSCDLTTRTSDQLNRDCKGIWDSVTHGADRIMSFTPNTANVCPGKTFVDDASDTCVDDGPGKMSGHKAIQIKSGQPVTFFQGNSGGDFYPANMTTSQGGIPFIHNLPSLCNTINSAQPGKNASCHNIKDAPSDVFKSMTITAANLPALDAAAQKYGMFKGTKQQAKPDNTFNYALFSSISAAAGAILATAGIFACRKRWQYVKNELPASEVFSDEKNGYLALTDNPSSRATKSLV